MQASSDNPFVGMFNSNLLTNRSGSSVLSAVFVYFTTLETFSQAFKIKNGTKEPGYARKMKNPVTILRQENVGDVLCDRFT